MINGLPPKTSAIRLNANDAPLIQRGLDSLYSPVDLVLAFLNGIFTGTATSPGLALATLTLSGALTGTTAAFSGAVSTGALTATSVTAATVSSASGFKTIVGPFIYSSGSASGSGQMAFGSYGGAAIWMPAFSGSIIALTANSNYSGAGTVTYVAQHPYGSGTALALNQSTGAISSVTIAKGKIPFSPGDNVAVGISFSAASTSVNCLVWLTVEMAA